MNYTGISCSKGIGIGKVLKISDYVESYKSDFNERNKKLCKPYDKLCKPEEELCKLKQAISVYKNRLESLSSSLDDSLGKNQGDIIRSHMIMLDDEEMLRAIYDSLDSGKSAEESVYDVLSVYSNIFENSDDEILRARSADVLDIRSGLLKILRGNEGTSYKLEPNTVLVGRNVLPSFLSEIDFSLVSGIVSGYGNDASHSAILAKSMGIPMISGAYKVFDSVNDGDPIIVDAINQEVITAPTIEQLAEYEKIRDSIKSREKELEAYKNIETVTTDGRKISLYCNLSGKTESKIFEDSGAEGVGLYRTEMIFMNADKMPSEDEQFKIYKSLAGCAGDRPVIIRTLDVGGDKPISYFNFSEEDNPFLGVRGIRFCLKETDVFKTQIKAILRASAYGKVSIMLPMITCISEFISAKEIIEECKRDLKETGISYDENIRVGCMIETPSAAILAEDIAKEADFISIGTNDLIQYTMCADRGNGMVSYLYSPFQPAVVRLIAGICRAGENANIPVEMCGEAAANEVILPLLIGLGLDALSVAPSGILALRSKICSLSYDKCKKTAEEALKINSEEAIFAHLKDFIETI